MSNPRALERIRFLSLGFSWVALLNLLIGVPMMFIAFFNGNANNSYMFGVGPGILSDSVLKVSLFFQFAWIVFRGFGGFFLYRALARIIEWVLAMFTELERRSGRSTDMEGAALPELNG